MYGCGYKSISTIEKSEMTAEDVAREMVNNPDYKEHVEEMIVYHLNRNPDKLKTWVDWFSGDDMTKYNP